ncbi:MAG: hypothetical protein RL448_535 [Actinomycetota bacterium]|jgi:hypothetical protein
MSNRSNNEKNSPVKENLNELENEIFIPNWAENFHMVTTKAVISILSWIKFKLNKHLKAKTYVNFIKQEDGDVPGWVLVVLMTTGLVTAIWTIAAPKLSSILKNSLDSMNGIR